MLLSQLRWQCSSDFDSMARDLQGLIVISLPDAA